MMKIYKAINAVQAELAKEGIGKDRKNEQQGYKFRGIDDVYNALAPLLAKHGLCILPRCTERVCVERVNTKGTALFYITVRCEFDFVASEDGTKHTVTTYGEAMDSGDKATNKAMSAAYKYACMQAFSIPTEGDNDADAYTHEVKAAPIVTPRGGIGDDLPDDIKSHLTDIALACTEHVKDGEPRKAWELIESQKLEADQMTWLANQMDSKTRAAIKAAKTIPR